MDIVGKPYSRHTRKYDGTQLTSHRMIDLLPSVLAKISAVCDQRSDLILAFWPDIIGSKLASMTKAVSFSGGVLIVNVKNSTLYSLLSQHEKVRLLKLLRQKFPHAEIKNLVFRMG